MVQPFQPFEKPEKSRLEELLLEQQEKSTISDKYLRAIIESSLDGIAVVDIQGNIEFGNDSFFNMVGWPKEELLGKSFSKMLTDDTRQLYLKIWSEYHNSNVNTEKIGEAEIITKDGEIRYLLKSRVMIVINGVKKILFFAKDITEKKKLELKLKESEARYRELFENALDPMYTHDMRGFFMSINKAGLEQLGCRENDEVIGTDISKWLTKESYKLVEERFKKIYSGEPLDQPVIIEVICKNGDHKWGEVRTNLIRKRDKIIGTYGIARDVTDKVILEKQLRESEAKYRDLFENAQDTMYVIDTEGCILKMNEVGLQTLGCTAGEVIGNNISEWLTPDSLKTVVERRKKLINGEKVNQTAILEIVRKDGEHRWVEIKTREIKDGGKRTKEIHGIARDITENRLLKQELKKSTKQQKLLCYLINGTRGGKSRALILKHLTDRSYNAHQLATVMNMDYKTIRHHLNVLIKNGIIGKDKNGYSDLYYISNDMEVDLNQELLYDKS